MTDKIKRYIRTVLVRLDERTFLDLKERCQERQIDEAVYCRKAVEICLKKDCIK
jgi:hypothetical protein